MIVGIVDTETTGLSDADEPISVGVILVDVDMPKGGIKARLSQFSGFRQPSVPVHPRARQVHGLSDEFLAGKTLNIDDLKTCLDQAEVLIAHNAKFDGRMLERLVPGIQNRSWRCSARQMNWKRLLEAGSNKLDDVCAALAVPRAATHDALGDCEALLSVLSSHSGKTTRSKTYLGILLDKSDFLVQPDPYADISSREPMSITVEVTVPPSVSQPPKTELPDWYRDTPTPRSGGRRRGKQETEITPGQAIAFILLCIFIFFVFGKHR